MPGVADKGSQTGNGTGSAQGPTPWGSRCGFGWRTARFKKQVSGPAAIVSERRECQGSPALGLGHLLVKQVVRWRESGPGMRRAPSVGSSAAKAGGDPCVGVTEGQRHSGLQRWGPSCTCGVCSPSDQSLSQAPELGSWRERPAFHQVPEGPLPTP